MMLRLQFAAALVAAGGAAYDFANPKVSSCVAAREAAWEGNTWLNTANANGYMCTKAQIDAHYDPANLVCWQSDPQGPTGDIASGRCPAGQAVQCLMQAGWGQVAGNCDACNVDQCSKTGAAGKDSCTALACAKDGAATDAGAKCTGNAWVPKASPVDPTHGDGYCDCAPDCAACDGPHVADVDSRMCDVRNGALRRRRERPSSGENRGRDLPPRKKRHSGEKKRYARVGRRRRLLELLRRLHGRRPQPRRPRRARRRRRRNGTEK